MLSSLRMNRLLPLAAALPAALSNLVWQTQRSEALLALPAPAPHEFRQILLDQRSRGPSHEDPAMPRPDGASFQRKKLSDDIWELTFNFRNFNRDELEVEFTVVREELEGSLREFGYSKKDLGDIFEKYKTAGQATYEEKVREYFMARGFRSVDKNTVMVDIPLLIRRNMKRMNGAAYAIQKVAQQQGYDSEDTIGMAIAMIQTAVAYRIPPPEERGRHIGGVHTPPQALIDGWGDCDTKSAALASILANWRGIRGVGVSLPRHYLIGLARIPRQGDVFLEFNGVQYVLIEPAGPAWLPIGSVSEGTQAMLDSAGSIPIQPF